MCNPLVIGPKGSGGSPGTTRDGAQVEVATGVDISDLISGNGDGVGGSLRASRFRLRRFAGFVFLLTIWSFGCNWRWRNTLPTVPERIVAESSQDWGRIVLAENHCALVNNVWNKAAAGGAFRQEVFVGEAAGTKIPGWRWSSPWHFIPRVVSQPQIVCGDKPWDAPSGLRNDFPFQAGSKRLTAFFKASLRASSVYNMSFTMWAVSSLPSTRSVITHEIMIWTVNRGQTPAGTRRGVLDVNGTTYDVYVEEKHGDASGANANVWMYVAFVARRPVLNGPLDLDAFIAYLLQQGLLTKDHFVTSVELGNEVSQGAGIVELRDFSVRIAERE